MQKLQLSIPEPCHENWQAMTPTQQGRFCNSCAKEVIDFSMMTDTEVLNYFTTLTHEKVCGRALPAQLDRAITRPKEPKKRLFWYWNYIVMFLMFFGKGNAAKAQGCIQTVTTEQINAIKNTNVKDALSGKVAGAIVGSNSNAIAGKETVVRLFSMNVIREGKGAIYVVDGVIQTNGSDNINSYDVEDYSVLQGPAAVVIFGQDASEGAVIITTKKQKEKTLDTVVVNSDFGVKKMAGTLGMVSVSGMDIEKLQEKISPAVEPDNSFKVYPNPAQRGNTINLSLKCKQTGLHQIHITDVNGRTVFYKRINAVTKEQTEMILCDGKWSAGLYYISLYDNKNKLVNKNSFIIQ